MMNGLKQSDGAIVPLKAANKGASVSAESLEERATTKGNPGRQSTRRTQCWVSVSQAADWIREAAGSAVYRQAPEVGAGWFNDQVRICAGGAQQWAFLPRLRGDRGNPVPYREKEAAQVRCEEWTRSESEARTRVGQLQCLLEQSRHKNQTQAAELKAVRRAAKEALKSQAEVQRLEQLLARAGVDSRRRSTNTQLRKEIVQLRDQGQKLEIENDQLRSSRSRLANTQYGSRREQLAKPSTGRQRGQQPGAPGHGRTPRPGLPEQTERHDPPESERKCDHCGKPTVANGDRVSHLIEIEVKAHRRCIKCTRWRRTCDCASSPPEQSAPPVPRLFPNTPYGISVWAHLLSEHPVCCRPLSQVARWLTPQGLPTAVGTLASRIPACLSLFEPLTEAMLAHQNQAAVRHGDETRWRVEAHRDLGRSSRGWLWISVSGDAVCFQFDPSRSTAAAKVLFGHPAVPMVLVCDRTSAYRCLAKELGGRIILQGCWSHQRRDVIDGATGRQDLDDWLEAWLQQFLRLFQLNKERLTHHDPRRHQQNARFRAAHAALVKASNDLFAQAHREEAVLEPDVPQRQPLRSLLKHREGLCVCLDRPEAPMTNHAAERALRERVILRQLTVGSHSELGARTIAVLHTVVATLKQNNMDVLRWLKAWLTACAEPGGQAPTGLSCWLPWSMTPERKQPFLMPAIE